MIMYNAVSSVHLTNILEYWNHKNTLLYLKLHVDDSYVSTPEKPTIFITIANVHTFNTHVF